MVCTVIHASEVILKVSGINMTAEDANCALETIRALLKANEATLLACLLDPTAATVVAMRKALSSRCGEYIDSTKTFQVLVAVAEDRRIPSESRLKFNLKPYC